MLEEAFGATKEIKATHQEDERNVARDIVHCKTHPWSEVHLV